MRRASVLIALVSGVGCAGEAPADSTGTATGGTSGGSTGGATTTAASSSSEGSTAMADSTTGGAAQLDVQGHRGDRGNTPPGNTLPSFEAALSYGVDTLEGDLQVTADGAVVFGHDDNLVTTGCTWAGDGAAPANAISDLSAEEVASWDCHPELDGIQPPPPLDAVLALDDTVGFSLELKRITNADADVYAAALIAYDQGCGGCLGPRLILQSFIWPQLQYTRETYGADLPFAAALLSAGPTTATLEGTLAYAQIWSPSKDGLTAEHVATAHALGLRVIPWTVNETDEMQTLVDAGVDGMITDYPDVLLDLLGR